MNRKESLQAIKKLLDEPLLDPEDSVDSAGYVFLETVRTIGKDKIQNPIPSRKYLNDALLGMRPNEFTIISGPSGSGKSTLLASLLFDCMSASIPCYVAPIEIGAQEFMRKMLSKAVGKDFYEIKEDENLNAPMVLLSKETCHFARYSSRVSHRTMLADILYCHTNFNTQIAFVDNINYMMEVRRGSDQIVEMDRVIHDFVVFCKRIPIHVVMVMHPKKTDNGRLESMFDIKGSSTSVQEAANVLLFNRMGDDLSEPNGFHRNNCRELKIEKARYNGRKTGKKIILAIEEKSDYLKEIGYV